MNPISIPRTVYVMKVQCFDILQRIRKLISKNVHLEIENWQSVISFEFRKPLFGKKHANGWTVPSEKRFALSMHLCSLSLKVEYKTSDVYQKKKRNYRYWCLLHSVRQVTLRLGCPVNRQLLFTFSLSYDEGEGRFVDSLRGIQLNQYGMHETVDNIAHFRIRLPRAGTFRLSVFAGDVTDCIDRQQACYTLCISTESCLLSCGPASDSSNSLPQSTNYPINIIAKIFER